MKHQRKELHEQAHFVSWCKEQGLEVYAVPLSTFTDSWLAINDNKTAGVRRGIPDIILFIPTNRSTTGKTHLLFIEMKKDKKDGKAYLSKEQKYFLLLVDQIYGDIHGKVCHGYKEAIAFVRPLTKEISEAEQRQWLIDNNLT